jgi:hypothetical protein
VAVVAVVGVVGLGVDLAAGVGMGLAEAVGLLPMDWVAAVGFMGLLPAGAWPTWGMGGVAMH